MLFEHLASIPEEVTFIYLGSYYNCFYVASIFFLKKVFYIVHHVISDIAIKMQFLMTSLAMPIFFLGTYSSPNAWVNS